MTCDFSPSGFHWTHPNRSNQRALPVCAGFLVDLHDDDRHNGVVDRDLRDWLRSLAVAHPGDPQQHVVGQGLSDQAADYLEQIAHDGTLKAALAELGASDPELAG